MITRACMARGVITGLVAIGMLAAAVPAQAVDFWELRTRSTPPLFVGVNMVDPPHPANSRLDVDLMQGGLPDPRATMYRWVLYPLRDAAGPEYRIRWRRKTWRGQLGGFLTGHKFTGYMLAQVEPCCYTNQRWAYYENGRGPLSLGEPRIHVGQLRLAGVQPPWCLTVRDSVFLTGGPLSVNPCRADTNDKFQTFVLRNGPDPVGLDGPW